MNQTLIRADNFPKSDFDNTGLGLASISQCSGEIRLYKQTLREMMPLSELYKKYFPGANVDLTHKN